MGKAESNACPEGRGFSPDYWVDSGDVEGEVLRWLADGGNIAGGDADQEDDKCQDRTGEERKEFRKQPKECDSFDKELSERFEFRNILPEEADQAAEIEKVCFPPNEACSETMMKERVAAAPELFLVAVDRKTGRLAGFLNGLSTKECAFRDEFFSDSGLYDPEGKNIMLLGLDVLPEYRGQGLAREIVSRYLCREQERGRRLLILTCLESKVKMYEKMGFRNYGIAKSSWGGEEWYEMGYVLDD